VLFSSVEMVPVELLFNSDGKQR